PSTLPRLRFYREFALNQANTFANDGGNPAARVQLSLRYFPCEWKAAAVILDDELPLAATLQKLNDDPSGPAVLAHIHQRFLYDAGQFAANRCGKPDFIDIKYQLCRNPGFALKALNSITEESRKLAGIHFSRLHLLHQFT